MNQSQLETLVEKHYESLFRFALSLAQNEPEASDLTQQTFLQLAKNGKQIRDIEKAKSWLFTTLRREFYALRKQQGKFQTIDSEDPNQQLSQIEAPEDVEMEVLKNADAQLVLAGLAELNELFRVPLALFYFEDFNYREIATILDIPQGTVMSRLSRGRNELRTWLMEKSTKHNNLPANVLPIDPDQANHSNEQPNTRNNHG